MDLTNWLELGKGKYSKWLDQLEDPLAGVIRNLVMAAKPAKGGISDAMKTCLNGKPKPRDVYSFLTTKV